MYNLKCISLDEQKVAGFWTDRNKEMKQWQNYEFHL
jgi:hypothetical protein